jgi:hypothetical protein
VIVPGTFRAAVEAKDFDAATRTLDPDVEFHSPVMVRPVVGKEHVTSLLRVLTDTFEDFHYTYDLVGTTLPRWPSPSGHAPDGEFAHGGAPAQALVFNAKVLGKSVQGMDMLTFNRQGLIVDFTVMIRPLPAAMTLARVVGRRIEELAASA